VVAPVEATVTLPLAPLVAELLSLTHTAVEASVPLLGVKVTEEE
jgi:hypothetical protein